MIEVESELSKQKLKQALSLYYDGFLETLPSDEELKKITFSEEFENKMEKLIRNQKKPYYSLVNTVGKRIAVIALIVLSSLIVTVMSVEAFRKPVISFFIEVYEKISTVIFIKDEDEVEIPKVIEKIYEPSFVPEGYVESSREEFNVCVKIEYMNKDGDSIFYEQKVMENLQMGIDTEGIETETIHVNTYEGIFYSNKGYNNIIWNDGMYCYSVFCTNNKEILVQIAESVKCKK